MSTTLGPTASSPNQPTRTAKAKNGGVTPVMAQYLAIKADHTDCLLFFRMGDFYELFFEDAETAAKALDITLTKRGKHEGRDIPMCGVPIHTAQSYLARLIRKGFKVAVAEQAEDSSTEEQRKAKTLVHRHVTRVVTAGTLTEETLLEARLHNFLAALVRVNGRLGIAWLDLSTGLFQVQGFADTAMADLATLLNRIDPSELLVTESLLEQESEATDIEKSPLAGVLKEWSKVISPLSAGRCDSRNGEKRLCQAYGVSELTAFGDFDHAEIAAAGVVLDYVELTQCQAVANLQPLRSEKQGSRMEIDPATARNLELLSRPDDTQRGGLVADIDRTLTGSGSRLLRDRIAAPSTNPEHIKKRLNAARSCLDNPSARSGIRAALRDMPDLERALSRLSLRRGGPRDLGAIRDGLGAAETLRVACIGSDGAPLESLAGWTKALSGFTSLHDRLKQALAAELPLKTSQGELIAPGYCENLDEQRRLRDESRRLIAELQARYVEQTDIASLRIKYNNILGYFIEIGAGHIDKLDGSMGFRHRQTMAGKVRFSSHELLALDVAIRQAADKALALEAAFFESLTNDILARARALRRLAAAVARLDVAAATAELAAERDFCRPEISQDAVFMVRDGRHPMVETALRQQDGDTFRANECRLDADDCLWLVTGPNMAGKSTFLRQNALIAVLAQAGLYVPATQACIGIVDRLFSRVGAADDLARGRSTFMVEMVETATILHRATERSLVILDEIGRGTATFDGLSIAWAVAEHIHEVNGCRALFATHYRELANLAAQLPRLSLHRMAVKEWKDEIRFLYAVEAGAATGSYGVHVARLAGLPATTLRRAQDVLATLEAGERGGSLAQLAGDLPLFSRADPTNSGPTRQEGLAPEHLTEQQDTHRQEQPAPIPRPNQKSRTENSQQETTQEHPTRREGLAPEHLTEQQDTHRQEQPAPVPRPNQESRTENSQQETTQEHPTRREGLAPEHLTEQQDTHRQEQPAPIPRPDQESRTENSQQETAQEQASQNVLNALAKLDPDSLNPRQALDWLYRLKTLSEQGDDGDHGGMAESDGA